jgi:Pyrimidine reductase, riboflavin biosynthesis
VSVDTKGEIGWESGTWKASGRPDAHVIEVLTESTLPAYKAYLRRVGVSYMICGKENLDCGAAAEKLAQHFGIEKVLVCGGGMVNGLFLQAGIIEPLGAGGIVFELSDKRMKKIWFAALTLLTWYFAAMFRADMLMISAVLQLLILLSMPVCVRYLKRNMKIQSDSTPKCRGWMPMKNRKNRLRQRDFPAWKAG